MGVNRAIAIAGIVFCGINILDLILTTVYFEYEINPLVANNYPLFYIIKMLSTWIILTVCIYKLNEETK